jgi:lysozyme
MKWLLSAQLLASTLVLANGRKCVKASKLLLKMLRHHEGVRYKPYQCPAGLWTIGVGHVLYPAQAKIPSTPEGMAKRKEYPLRPEDNRRWSEEEVDELLAKDVVRFERGVERFIPVRLSQGEFDCLVSFSFNLGLGTLQRSTLRQALLRGDKTTAMQSLLKYNKAGGKILRGLDNRRKDEAALFLS